MERRSITLYTRPECELCAEALQTLRQIAATATIPLVITEVNVEGDPALHRRLLTEIPAIEYAGRLLPHATGHVRITAFIDAIRVRVANGERDADEAAEHV